MAKYMVSVACSWIEVVNAKSMEDAVRKTEKKYRYRHGHIPREYIEVCPERMDGGQDE